MRSVQSGGLRTGSRGCTFQAQPSGRGTRSTDVPGQEERRGLHFGPPLRSQGPQGMTPARAGEGAFFMRPTCYDATSSRVTPTDTPRNHVLSATWHPSAHSR